MSSSTLTKARRLEGSLHQRSRESLSHLARNLLLPCHSCQSNRLPTAESASSAHVFCKAILFRKPISHPLALSQPFNAHRASIVGRFSPIHF